jgi:hypothetical protein
MSTLNIVSLILINQSHIKLSLSLFQEWLEMESNALGLILVSLALVFWGVSACHYTTRGATSVGHALMG